MPATLSSLAPPAPEGATERALQLAFAGGRWRINDQVFEMGRYPIDVARGTREAWLFSNDHASMPHAMHVHGFPMRVVAREASPDAIAALAVDDRGRLPTDLGVKDTVLVWPGETVRALIDFAHPFPGRADLPGALPQPRARGRRDDARHARRVSPKGRPEGERAPKREARREFP